MIYDKKNLIIKSKESVIKMIKICELLNKQLRNRICNIYTSD